jgi:hypothetical protein
MEGKLRSDPTSRPYPPYNFRFWFPPWQFPGKFGCQGDFPGPMQAENFRFCSFGEMLGGAPTDVAANYEAAMRTFSVR